MADGVYRILHRKDETGVIVDSGVFGPDDEVPEGFGPQEFEVVKVEARVATQEESKLTSWESPVAKGSFSFEPQPDDALNDAELASREEVNEGTPIQARTEDDQTGAEQEALGALEVPVPPKSGPGSGKQTWAAYAAAKGVEVAEDDTRDDIIAACEAAGVPTD